MHSQNVQFTISARTTLTLFFTVCFRCVSIVLEMFVFGSQREGSGCDIRSEHPLPPVPDKVILLLSTLTTNFYLLATRRKVLSAVQLSQTTIYNQSLLPSPPYTFQILGRICRSYIRTCKISFRGKYERTGRYS